MRFRFTYIAASAVKSVWRSALVYIGSSILDIAVYTLLSRIALPLIFAQSAAYTAGALNRYLAYKFIKFRGRPDTGEFVRFAVLNSVILLISAEILVLLNLIMPPAAAKLLVTAASAAGNAFLNRYAVFGA